MTRAKGSPNTPPFLLPHDHISNSIFSSGELVLPKLESISKGNNEGFVLILISHDSLGKVRTRRLHNMRASKLWKT